MVTFFAQPADGKSVWWLWVFGGLGAWMAIALLVAVIVGRGIRLADRRSLGTGEATVITTADIPSGATARPSSATVRRRAIPLPPLGIALAALAVALETVGYVNRLNGSTARLLSMDAPLSLPRMFVAALFAAASLAALAGAGSIPGRRTWWTAVGVVGVGVAAVKAGSNVHAWAMHALSDSVGTVAALLVSVAAAGVVLAVLGFVSRTERRDRRRVLSVLALYAVAAVGLSAVSSLVAGAYGGASNWAAVATFVEESGEALAGVAFLMAVLAGVAPRVVLPGSWALRREVDAHTLDLPEQVPGHTASDGPSRF